MATVAQNIATIQTKAAELDTLVMQFRATAAIIKAAESEIASAQPGANHHIIDGRARLSLYAHDRMIDDRMFGLPSVAARASSAWSGVS